MRFIPSIILPHLFFPLLKTIPSLFYFYTSTQTTSTVCTLLHPVRSHWYPPPNRVCFTYLSFIFKVYINCSRGFAVVFCPTQAYIYCTLIRTPSSTTLSFSVSPVPHYSIVFSTFCYAFLAHKCNVFPYYLLSFSLLLGLPQSPSTILLL
jgi:hypothetical protein